MERYTKRILIAIGLAALFILVIALVAGLASSGRGGGEVEGDPLELPKFVNSSLCPADYGPRPLLLVSLDGFRPDYLGRSLTPSILEVADKGVQADYLMPSYPTVTYPNHYTIVTGLYPEAHGIVANKFNDTQFGESFALGTNESREGKWWGGEPIWNTVTSQDKNSATFFWPGSDADIGGKRPTYWKLYNGSISYEDRVLQVLEWLKLDKDRRPSFVSLYFNEPDHAGHDYGPISDEVNEQIKCVDKIIRMLMNGLKDRNLIHCVNVIILSDHGMTEAGSERVIDLQEYLPDLKEEADYQGSVVAGINPKDKSEDVARDMLEKLSCKKDEMRVYLKEGVPKRLHFSKNPRIVDIVLELDPGHTIQFNSTWALEGQHGYDNYFPDMNAIFIAYGPDFKPSLKIKPFQNIELYNLMCHLMEVKPAENNGTVGSLYHVMRNPPPIPEVPKVTKPPVLRFPTNDKELETNWNASGCNAKTKYSEQPWMSPLNMTEKQEKASEAKHLPWGIPGAAESLSPSISLLYHQDHVTGFSSQHKMPLWTSFTLNSDEVDKVWHEPLMSEWVSDVRLSDVVSPSCPLFQELEKVNYIMFTLFPITQQVEQTGAGSASHMVSNAIPVSTYFAKDWIDFMNLLPHWTKSNGPLNFLMGPVFDTMDNPDVEDLTKKGISIPSDLFVILTHCRLDHVTKLDLCHARHLDTRSFILHQYQPVDLCFETITDYLIKFSATIKDVERVTHLTLFPNIPYLDRVNLTLMAHPDIWSHPEE